MWLFSKGSWVAYTNYTSGLVSFFSLPLRSSCGKSELLLCVNSAAISRTGQKCTSVIGFDGHALLEQNPVYYSCIGPWLSWMSSFCCQVLSKSSNGWMDPLHIEVVYLWIVVARNSNGESLQSLFVCTASPGTSGWALRDTGCWTRCIFLGLVQQGFACVPVPLWDDQL